MNEDATEGGVEVVSADPWLVKFARTRGEEQRAKLQRLVDTWNELESEGLQESDLEHLLTTAKKGLANEHATMQQFLSIWNELVSENLHETALWQLLASMGLPEHKQVKMHRRITKQLRKTAERP